MGDRQELPTIGCYSKGSGSLKAGHSDWRSQDEGRKVLEINLSWQSYPSAQNRGGAGMLRQALTF